MLRVLRSGLGLPLLKPANGLSAASSHATSRLMLGPTAVLFAIPNRKKKHVHTRRPENELNPLSKPTTIDPRVLYVVSVPIGNVKDFTLRALDVLRGCDYIICADRTNTRAFLDLIDIDHAGRLIQLNKHAKDSNALIDLVKSGSSVAFVVSQGTPCVGDEGGRVIRDMMTAGIRVSPIPGVDACTTALTMSGANTSIDGGAFRFGAYLSNKRGQRLTELMVAARCTHPSVYFEAGSRLLDTLADIAVVAPNRRVAVMHEMTKLYEATHADRVERLIRYYQRGSMQRSMLKGQICVVIDGALPSSKLSAVSNNAVPVRVGGLLQGVDGDAGKPSQNDSQRFAEDWRQGLQEGFVYFAVSRCVSRTGQSVEEACRTVATALRMPLNAVVEAFNAEDNRVEAEAGLAEKEEATQRDATLATPPVDPEPTESNNDAVLGAVHMQSAAALQQDQRYGVTSTEARQRASKDAAARFLSLRVSLRASGAAAAARQRDAMTRPATGDFRDHTPSDWAEETVEPDTKVETRADFVQQAHDAAAPSDSTNTVKADDTSDASQPKKRSDKSVRRRLALMRKVEERKEHVRLLQLSLLSREGGRIGPGST